MALGAAGMAWSQCIQGSGTDQAQYVLQADGTLTCARLGQTGCRVDKGKGTCKAPEGLFTATSTLAGDGSVTWSLGSHTVGIDAVLIGGGSGGNACAYFYPEDAETGQSGLGFRRRTNPDQFANVPYVEFCTNQKDDIPAPAPAPLVPTCSVTEQTALDRLGFGVTINYQFDIELGVVSGLCVQGGLDAAINNPENPVKVIECINEPVPITGPTELPLCSEVLSPEGNPFILKNNSTYFMAGVEGSSCVYTCVPPPLTLGGRSQCGYICQ